MRFFPENTVDSRKHTVSSEFSESNVGLQKKTHVFVFSDFESVGDDEPTVVATARGTFNSRGGTLTSEETGVSICIPSGAIPAGFEQEIYFKVCKDNTMLPPLDADKGERSSFT